MSAPPEATGPQDLGRFYREHPEFLWGPALITGIYQIATRSPKLAGILEKRGMQAYGFEDTAIYIAFAIVLSYAAHGWYAVHVNQVRQLQSFDRKQNLALEKPKAYVDRDQPVGAAVRTVATLLTSVVYASVPFGAATASWGTFIAWTMMFAIYWDLHFFIVHKTVHEHGTLYKWIHKLHHSQKQPHVFTAYFVTYQSHFLTEQMVVLLGAACGMPRNVFTWTMWWGTLATFVEHGGHDVESVKLGPLPITFGQLCTLLSPWSLVLGGTTPAEHDWHHEKFTTNYSLSFPYLDKLFGSFHPGRVPGEAIGMGPKSKMAKAPLPVTREKELDPLPVVGETLPASGAITPPRELDSPTASASSAATSMAVAAQ